MNAMQLKIVLRAVKIRMAAGEELEDILASYTKLTEEDIKFIRDNI